MSLKKYFITISLVLIVAVLGIMIYLLIQKKETVSQEQTQNQESTIPVSFPSGTETSMSQENIKLAQKIFENIIQETISDETKKEGSKRVAFQNQKGSPIPLSDFEKALDVAIYPKLRNYLSNDYQIFYCPGPDGKKEFGLYLQYDMDKIYRGFTYDLFDMMKDWESTIFHDLHAVLFPGINFSENDLNQKIEFRDGRYRYAEVNLPNGKKGSIQYDDILEFGITVATSPSCLDNVSQYYESAD